MDDENDTTNKLTGNEEVRLSDLAEKPKPLSSSLNWKFISILLIAIAGLLVIGLVVLLVLANFKDNKAKWKLQGNKIKTKLGKRLNQIMFGRSSQDQN